MMPASTVSASDTMVMLDQCTGAEDPTWLTIESTTTDAVCRNDPFDTNPGLVPCNTITKTSITTSRIERHGLQAVGQMQRWGRGGLLRRSRRAHSTVPRTPPWTHTSSMGTLVVEHASVAWRFFKNFWK
jgi:hypothetical protein